MNLVNIAECSTEFDAYLVINFLEAKGIRAHLAGGRAAPSAGLAAGIPFGAVVQVDESDAARVAELLTKRNPPEEEADDTNNWPNTVGQWTIWSLLAFPFAVALVHFFWWLFSGH